VYESVRVEFEPPRKCESFGKAFKLTADGQEDVWLPVSKTELEVTGEAEELVIAATIPRYIAEDRGLLKDAHSPVENSPAETMSRDDWFLLGLTMAKVICGDVSPVWEAKKLVIQLLNEKE